LAPQKYTSYLSFVSVRACLKEHRKQLANAVLKNLGKQPAEETEELNKPAYSWHPESQNDKVIDCTRCRLYRAVALGAADHIRDMRNMAHACEVANVGERDYGSRRGSIFNELFEAAQLKEMNLEGKRRTQGKRSGTGSGSGAGYQIETIGRKKQGKEKEVAPVSQTPQIAAPLMADKWVWGLNLTPKDIQNMVRGSDRGYQIPHSGYDDDLKSGRLAGKSSPIPTPDVIEDPGDPNVLFDELSNDIGIIPELKPAQFPLAFAFPPLHHTAASDSDSRPEIQAFSKLTTERKKHMQAEVDEPVSPSSSYSGPIIPKRTPPRRPWLVPPPLGYVSPPSIQTNIAHDLLSMHMVSEPGPTLDRNASDVPSHHDILETSGHSMRSPIHIASDDGTPPDHRMDYSEDASGPVGGLGSEDNVQIPIGDLGLPPEVFMESTPSISNVSTALSPDQSVVMGGIMSDSDPDSDPGGDIHETDPNAHPPLTVYTSDVDLDDESDGGKVTTNEDEEIEVPHTVYVPGSDSEEEDIEVPYSVFEPESEPEPDAESNSVQNDAQTLLHPTSMLFHSAL